MEPAHLINAELLHKDMIMKKCMKTTCAYRRQKALAMERESNVAYDYKSLLPTTNINNSKLPQNWTSFQHKHIQTRLKLN